MININMKLVRSVKLGLRPRLTKIVNIIISSTTIDMTLVLYMILVQLEKFKRHLVLEKLQSMLFLRWKVHYAKEALLLVNNLRISWGVVREAIISQKKK